MTDCSWQIAEFPRMIEPLKKEYGEMRKGYILILFLNMMLLTALSVFYFYQQQNKHRNPTIPYVDVIKIQ